MSLATSTSSNPPIIAGEQLHGGSEPMNYTRPIGYLHGPRFDVREMPNCRWRSSRSPLANRPHAALSVRHACT